MRLLTVPATNESARRARFGALSFMLGGIAAIGVTMLGLVSFVAAFDPPGWLRVAAMAPIPFAVVASVALGLPGLRGEKRGLALGGLILTALSAIAFVIMIAHGE